MAQQPERDFAYVGQKAFLFATGGERDAAHNIAQRRVGCRTWCQCTRRSNQTKGAKRRKREWRSGRLLSLPVSLAQSLFQFADAGFGPQAGQSFRFAGLLGPDVSLAFGLQGGDVPVRCRVAPSQFAVLPSDVQIERGL